MIDSAGPTPFVTWSHLPSCDVATRDLAPPYGDWLPLGCLLPIGVVESWGDPSHFLLLEGRNAWAWPATKATARSRHLWPVASDMDGLGKGPHDSAASGSSHEQARSDVSAINPKVCTSVTDGKYVRDHSPPNTLTMGPLSSCDNITRDPVREIKLYLTAKLKTSQVSTSGSSM